MKHGKPKIAPSMMCADFLHLADELRLLEEHGADWLHIDIMDGHYVPNLTLGIDYCRALAGATRIPCDVHLMVERPEAHAEPFCRLPGARVTFHPETTRQPVRLIARIRELGASPGIAIEPGIPVGQFRHLYPLVDQVTIMTVNPGYAGQKLLPHCIEKIAELRARIDRESLAAEISVDGNASWQNIPKMAGAGAGILVLGTSALFERHRPRRESFAELKTLLEKLSGTPPPPAA
jgi:ribulose-phosphate 3-epimerase